MHGVGVIAAEGRRVGERGRVDHAFMRVVGVIVAQIRRRVVSPRPPLATRFGGNLCDCAIGLALYHRARTTAENRLRARKGDQRVEGSGIARPVVTTFEDALGRVATALGARGGKVVVYWPAETEVREPLADVRAELVREHRGESARLSYSYDEDCFEITVLDEGGHRVLDGLYVDSLRV
jgi:hypothetical protein